MGTARMYLYTVIFSAEYRKLSNPESANEQDYKLRIIDEYPCGGKTRDKILGYLSNRNGETYFRKIAKPIYAAQKKLTTVYEPKIIIDTYLLRKSGGGYRHRIMKCWSYQYNGDECATFIFPDNIGNVISYITKKNFPEDYYTSMAQINEPYLYTDVATMYEDFYSRTIAANNIGIRLESNIDKVLIDHLLSVAAPGTPREKVSIDSIIEYFRNFPIEDCEKLDMDAVKGIIKKVGDNFDWKLGYVEPEDHPDV